MGSAQVPGPGPGPGRTPWTLGMVLNDARKAAGRSLMDLSTATGIPVVELNMLFHGRTKAPRPMHLVRIADALGIPVERLFASVDHEPPALDE